MATSSKPLPCPCGGPGIMRCCGPFIAGAALPPTAEALMRSRYTAFVMKDEDYLRKTWHPSTRPTENLVDKDEKIQWLGLEIKSDSGLRLRQRKEESPEQPDHDTVEFVARFRINGRAQRLHEVSRFVREPDPAVGGKMRWFYVDGSFPE